MEVERFQHQDDFKQSALWAEIKETMSSTRNSRNDEARPSSSTTDASTRGREAGCPVSAPTRWVHICIEIVFH